MKKLRAKKKLKVRPLSAMYKIVLTRFNYMFEMLNNPIIPVGICKAIEDSDLNSLEKNTLMNHFMNCYNLVENKTILTRNKIDCYWWLTNDKRVRVEFLEMLIKRTNRS